MLIYFFAIFLLFKHRFGFFCISPMKEICYDCNALHGEKLYNIVGSWWLISPNQYYISVMQIAICRREITGEGCRYDHVHELGISLIDIIKHCCR